MRPRRPSERCPQATTQLASAGLSTRMKKAVYTDQSATTQWCRDGRRGANGGGLGGTTFAAARIPLQARASCSLTSYSPLVYSTALDARRGSACSTCNGFMTLVHAYRPIHVPRCGVGQGHRRPRPARGAARRGSPGHAGGRSHMGPTSPRWPPSCPSHGNPDARMERGAPMISRRSGDANIRLRLAAPLHVHARGTPTGTATERTALRPPRKAY